MAFTAASAATATARYAAGFSADGFSYAAFDAIVVAFITARDAYDVAHNAVVDPKHAKIADAFAAANTAYDVALSAIRGDVYDAISAAARMEAIDEAFRAAAAAAVVARPVLWPHLCPLTP